MLFLLLQFLFFDLLNPIETLDVLILKFVFVLLYSGLVLEALLLCYETLAKHIINSDGCICSD